MTPIVEKGKMRFVLSWPYAPRDLDIHSLFKISKFSKCEVYFGKRDCAGTVLDVDNFNGGSNGVETITINTLGQYIYTFAVHKFVQQDPAKKEDEKTDPGAKIPNIPLSKSKAKISVYSSEFKGPIYQLEIPSFSDNNLIEKGKSEDDYTWWMGFCLDGKKGLNSLALVNKLTTEKPNYTLCENLFK
jgi:hypothetical protein